MTYKNQQNTYYPGHPADRHPAIFLKSIMVASLVLAITLYCTSCRKQTSESTGSSSPAVSVGIETIIELKSTEEFFRLIGEQTVTLVDFNADWCGPCKRLKPTLEELAKEYNGKIKIVSVNVDHFPDLAGQFQVNSIPAVFFFKARKAEGVLIGLYPKDKYVGAIEQLLVN